MQPSHLPFKLLPDLSPFNLLSFDLLLPILPSWVVLLFHSHSLDRPPVSVLPRNRLHQSKSTPKIRNFDHIQQFSATFIGTPSFQFLEGNWANGSEVCIVQCCGFWSRKNNRRRAQGPFGWLGGTLKGGGKRESGYSASLDCFFRLIVTSGSGIS